MTRNIIVIGTSAGGFTTLSMLLSQLPAEFPASIFIVQHISSSTIKPALVENLQRKIALSCKFAEDGETFFNGYIYFAPPGYHMLLKEKIILLTRGPLENRSRPAIDPLFRSAAAHFDSRVTGVVLSGMLDDGTAGLDYIKRSGGITIVQDPKDALYPEMPQSAVDNVEVDYCVPVSEMGYILQGIVHQPAKENVKVPTDILREAEIAERMISDITYTKDMGKLTPYECPICGGALWQTNETKFEKYRCHTGHTFTYATFFKAKSEKLEETLWMAIRMLEERRNIFRSSTEFAKKNEMQNITEIQEQKIQVTQEHIDSIRKILVSLEK